MNILVTGGDGFIGKNIIDILSKNSDLSFFNGNRNNINLLSHIDIKKYIIQNKIDIVIHCAIEGGKRGNSDTSNVFYNNLLIYNNLMGARSYFDKFINVSSGAEFDRRFDIINICESELFNKYPIDYYGLSKNIIAKENLKNLNNINLRIFGCFNHNESNTRMIKACIMNYINKTPMILHQDCYMDFIYVPDYVEIVKYFIYNKPEINDINAAYEEKYKLSDIAHIINNLNDYKVPVNIGHLQSLTYTGDGNKLNSLNLKLKKLEVGIKECYNVLHNNKNSI